MNTNTLVLIEMLFFFGALSIFIGWQFISLNRDNKKAAAEKRAKENEAKTGGSKDGN